MLPNQLRCRYLSPSGRRCRADALIGWQFCRLHGDPNPDNPDAAPIVPDGDRLDTAESIHAVMARILRGQATGKFRSKDATAMMYSCQTLLSALPRLAEERKKISFVNEQSLRCEKILADSHPDKLNGVDADPDDEKQQAK
jgi:hypothetical protein